MRRAGRHTLARYEVRVADTDSPLVGRLIGHVEKEYHTANAWPGVVGYTPGRNLYRFLADQVEERYYHLSRYRRHGEFFDRLADCRTALAEDGLMVGPRRPT